MALACTSVSQPFHIRVLSFFARGTAVSNQCAIPFDYDFSAIYDIFASGPNSLHYFFKSIKYVNFTAIVLLLERENTSFLLLP